MSYDGYQIKCGCRCGRCHRLVVLEGYADAWGSHYCSYCDDYVQTINDPDDCNARTPEKVERREETIIRVGALNS